MSIATSTAIGIAGAAGLAGAGISAISSNAAANTGADAANHAADISRQNAIDALTFQKQQYGNSLSMLNPYLQTGYGALSQLRNFMGINAPGANQGFSLPSSSTSSVPTGGGGGLDPSSLAGGAGLTRGVPRPMNADGAFVGNASTLQPNNPNNTINGISPVTSQFPGGPQSFGSPGGTSPLSGGGATVPLGGPMASGNPGGGAIQANGGGSAVVPFGSGAGAVPGTGGGTDVSSFGAGMTPYGSSFQAPTNVTEQNDPGYQFRLQQGLQAVQNSAAARGGLLGGNAAKAMNDYAQGSASNEYGNVYNRAMSTFDSNYNQYNQDQNTVFNRLAAMSGMGQTSAAQLGADGLTAGNGVANTLLTSSGQIGQQLNNAGAATASGYAGVGNAASGGVSGLGNLALLSSILNKGGGGGGSVSPFSLGDPSICWIAEELYGVDAPETHAIRGWLKNEYSKTPVGEKFVDWYLEHGESVAAKIKHDPFMRETFQSLFDKFAISAMPKPLEDFESVRYQR